LPTTPVNDLPAIRPTGDARERTVALLSDAYARDLLTMREFELRMEAVYRADSGVELARITADLPQVGNTRAQEATALVGGARQSLSATFSSVEDVHFTVMPTLFELRALFGSIELDLRHTIFQPGVTEIHIDATMGNIELIVPAHLAIERHGEFVFSSYAVKNKGFKAADLFLPPDAPILRLTGQTFMSNVEIKRVLR
jgi:Domain of unknown function (DUF1707)/Cell wall-active antibiotics response 4TMS YvqF